MEIFLPSRNSNSTHPVSMLNLQALSSYFIIASSNSRYQLTVYDKVSEFCTVHGSLHSQTQRKRKIRTLLQSERGSDFSCLVGAGGFEPPKLKAADLQSVPIGHSGTRPYSFVCPAGRPVYFSMEGWICQHFSANFCRYFSKPGSGQKSPVGARKKGTRRGLEAHAFSYRSLRSLKNQ